MFEHTEEWEERGVLGYQPAWQAEPSSQFSAALGQFPQMPTAHS